MRHLGLVIILLVITGWASCQSASTQAQSPCLLPANTCMDVPAALDYQRVKGEVVVDLHSHPWSPDGTLPLVHSMITPLYPASNLSSRVVALVKCNGYSCRVSKILSAKVGAHEGGFVRSVNEAVSHWKVGGRATFEAEVRFR